MPFTKGKDDEANQFLKDLAEDGFHATYEQDVNWQSFQTLVRDRLKKGEDVPLAELGIHLMPEAKIRLPNDEN